MTYTKGKWYIWHTNNAGDIIQTTTRQIATVVDGHWYDKVQQEESKSNAQLISASPEMYEALKALLRYSMIHEVQGVEYPDGSHKDWIFKASKAIAKAEGK